MKLKVCGMREPKNIQHLLEEVTPDFIGFIFYAKSPRYVTEVVDVPTHTKKVGVFVNETTNTIQRLARQHGLDYVQLHGDEPPAQAKELKDAGLGVIKVFSVADALPEGIGAFDTGSVDYVLFDTKTPAYGGSGQKFDWGLMNDYDGEVPFLLSGGIDADDLEKIHTLGHPKLLGIDINSKFELAPAVKDIKKIAAFKVRLQE